MQGAISWYLAFRHAIDSVASAAENLAEAAESHPLGRQLRQALFKTRRGRIYRIVFEVSDTEINTSAVRAQILRHALLAYLFGTVIVALTINMVAGLSK